MYDISNILFQQNTFTRNCVFKYYTDSQGRKVFKAKEAELKIEQYSNAHSLDKDGIRIGYKTLNLSEFINKGFVTKTFRMDKNGGD